MSNQINMFAEVDKARYRAYYNNFYKGVKERYQKELREAKTIKFKTISILINK